MRVITDTVRKLFISEDLISKCRMKASDFTRERVLTFERVTTFIINLARKSLQLELYSFADILNIPDCTKQAFSKARQKLNPHAFKLMNSTLLQEFYSDNIIKTFKGMRVLAIDGSTVHLPKTPELCEKYGYETAKDTPIARTSIMFDVLNNVTLNASINRYTSNERSLTLNHIDELSKQNDAITNKSFQNDILVFDRGYPSSSLMALLHAKKFHFVMRISNSFFHETNEAINAGLQDTIITISPYRKGRFIHPDFKSIMADFDKNLAIKVRVLVFDLDNGQKEIILTSLIDQGNFTYEDIFELYRLRWNIEEEIKFHKSIAEIENFSGNTAIAIEQDFYATIFTCNYCSLLMQEAQDELEAIGKKGKYRYKGNRNIVIGIVKNEIIDIFLTDRNLDEYCESIKNRIKKNLVPVRPERSYPRKFKLKSPKINRRCL